MFAAPSTAIITPAIAGPAKFVKFVAPSRNVFARETACSSVPTIAGIKARWHVK